MREAGDALEGFAGFRGAHGRLGQGRRGRLGQCGEGLLESRLLFGVPRTGQVRDIAGFEQQLVEHVTRTHAEAVAQRVEDHLIDRPAAFTGERFDPLGHLLVDMSYNDIWHVRNLLAHAPCGGDLTQFWQVAKIGRSAYFTSAGVGMRRHSNASTRSVGTIDTVLITNSDAYPESFTRKPDRPPMSLPGKLASALSKAYCVAVKLRLTRPDMKATSTGPANPCAKLSPESVATKAHVCPGWAAISRYSMFDSATPTAATASRRRISKRVTAQPPSSAPTMPMMR